MSQLKLEEKYSLKLQPLFELDRELLKRDYEAKTYENFGFTDENIDELLELALDQRDLKYDYDKYEEELNRFSYGTIHAVYALSYLKAIQTIEPLFQRIIENGFDDFNEFLDNAFVEFSRILNKDVLPLIESLLFTHIKFYEAITLMESLKSIAQNYPELFTQIEKILLKYINNDEYHETSIAFAISILMKNSGAKHIDLIRETFKTKNVDESFAGDLEDIEIELGLREKRTTPHQYCFVQDEKNDTKKSDLNSSNPIYEARTEPKIGRNEPCPCGSGKKYKKCCLNK